MNTMANDNTADDGEATPDDPEAARQIARFRALKASAPAALRAAVHDATRAYDAQSRGLSVEDLLVEDMLLAVRTLVERGEL